MGLYWSPSFFFISIKKRDIWRLRSFAGMSSIFRSSPAEVRYRFQTFMSYRVFSWCFQAFALRWNHALQPRIAAVCRSLHWLLRVCQCFQCSRSRLYHQVIKSALTMPFRAKKNCFNFCKLKDKNSRKRYRDRGQRQENPNRAKNQPDFRIRHRTLLEKKNKCVYCPISGM